MLRERLKSLALNLERMEVLYLRAIDILEREKRSLVLFDYSEFYTLFKEKDEVLAAIRGLDKDRLRVQDIYAVLNKQESGQVSLLSMARDLISLGGDDEVLGNRLLVLRNNLGHTIENLRQKIDHNRSFTEKSIQNLKGVAEHLSAMVQGRHSNETKAPVYTGRGKFKQQVASVGGLLEKRL